MFMKLSLLNIVMVIRIHGLSCTDVLICTVTKVTFSEFLALMFVYFACCKMCNEEPVTVPTTMKNSRPFQLTCFC